MGIRKLKHDGGAGTQMKHLVNFENFTKDDIVCLINLAYSIKIFPEKYADRLKGKKLYTLFEKTSTRTYLSFATGMTELGGTAYNQNWEDSNFLIGETTSEIKYVGRNVDIIMARLKKSETTRLFEQNSTVPFINGCDNTFHPCQALADILTICEKCGTYERKVLYIGAKNNTFNSLCEIICKLGGTIYGLTPLVNAMGVDDSFYDKMKATGHYIEVPASSTTDEIRALVKEMDVVYTDTWVDMEFFNNPAYREKKEETIAKMMPYQVNEKLMEGSRAIVLHDMPIHEGFEISKGVMDENIEHILDQAENRRHAEKAIMLHLLGCDKIAPAE